MKPLPQPVKRPFTSCSRQEVDLKLQVLAGKIPTDLQGHVYLNSPCGTVNSPTPYPKNLPNGRVNGEWGDMIFNGDAMLFRFDLDQPDTVSVKSAILRTPCYWADEATKYGTSYYDQGLYFKSMGIGRTSLKLGVRNQVNTALTPFRFAPNQPTRVTANFDVGRPFELDPVSLKLKTAIGANSEWSPEFPLIAEQVFPMIQSTAHPSFDPQTREFFTVCYQKTFGTMFFSEKMGAKLLAAQTFILTEFNKLERTLGFLKLKAGKFVQLITRFIAHLHEKIEGKSGEFHPLDVLKELDGEEPGGEFSMENAVYLLRWTGQGPLQRWNVLDADTGKNIVIEQCMHQTNFSRDYLVLVDSSVKFALDIMENVPFPDHPWLNEVFRKLTAKTVLPETPLYLIKRSDLKKGVANVTAKKFVIPLETVHYSVDYDNPGGRVTIHTAHNSASCAAEWVRPYDFLATDPDQGALPNTYGLMACGELDIGRIGKFVVQGDTGKILSQQIIHEKGFAGDDVGNVKAHTWAVALNTFRDIISPDVVVNKLVYNFWQCYGLDYRMMTKFMKELYEDYVHRLIPVDDLLSYTRHGVPFCLVRQNTETMKLEDYYLFAMNQNLRSIQFVPRKRAKGERPTVHPQLDGYILCTMVNGSAQDLTADQYTREVWLFDAAKLSAGPVCKLFHPDLDYSFTIHSAWVPDCQSFDGGYSVSVRDDYEEVISHFWNADWKAEMQTFLEKNVYPHYEPAGR
jgi:carotenoid cleavage dioxygenase-like enzyme